MTKPRAWHGALAGAALGTAFIAVSFLGWTAFDLPFLPFDLFDWIARALPGSAATFGVDVFVSLSRLIGGENLGAAAKPIEQATAMGGLLLVAAIGGAAAFAFLRLIHEPALLLGAIMGAMLGGIALVIEYQLDRIDAGPALSGPWVFATVAACGVAFGWIHDRLSGGVEGALAGERAGDEARRRFLIQLGGSSVLAAIASALAGALVFSRTESLAGSRWSDTHPLPNADAPVVPVAGTRPEFTPLYRHYRVDTNTRAPRIDPAEWRLRVTGMVQRPLAWTLGELRQWDPLHQFATLSCISNPPGGDLISTTRWTGVSLKRLLQAFVLSESATHLRIVSADGFSESVAIAAIRSDERIMLAYSWDGVPLPADHGFPLRLYVPDLYGMKQPKWIVAIEATDRWTPGYWVSRGWDREGRIGIVSAIDTINPVSGDSHDLGGAAFAGTRGVSKVEVRVDEGEWQPAELRQPPLSETTWVLWRARLAVSPGNHAFTVRAFDGQGRPQTADFHRRSFQS
jgi:DMSO/TMAO reductase YedYZ molybdopterin-dependent catalytic subunit